MNALMYARFDARPCRREYYGNLAVEALQRVIATGTLIGFAVFAAVFSRNARASGLINGLVIVGLVHLAHVSREREGGDLVRRGLLADTVPVFGDDGAPYRSTHAAVQRCWQVSKHAGIRDAVLAAAFTAATFAALR